MCGLALAANKKGNVGKRAFDLFTKQRHRGTLGFGYIGITNGVMTALERSKTEDGIKPTLLKERADLVLLHHRKPTSTENTLGTTHPIFVQNSELEYDYYVMHNGVISNDNELKTRHEALGYEYTTEFFSVEQAVYKDGRKEVLNNTGTSFNDSESLAIELARVIDGKKNRVEALGAAAFFVVQLKKNSEHVAQVYYGQNYGRQLGFKKKKGWTLVVSEHGKEVPQMKLFCMDPKTYEIKESDIDMDRGYTPSTIYNSSLRNPSTPRQGNLSLPASKTNEYGLVNAYYTRKEVEESGAPMSEFFTTTSMYLDGKWQATYVPAVFAGKDLEERPLFRDEYYMVEVDDPKQPENLERLEELAMKYARKQHEFDYIADSWVNDRMNYQTYQSRKNTLQVEMERLEEEISTLGVDQQEVEETLQIAQEFVDYEYSQ